MHFIFPRHWLLLIFSFFVHFRTKDCDPRPASSNTRCLLCVSTLQIDPKSEDKDYVWRHVIAAIRKDQTEGAYFSYLQGFKGLPPPSTADSSIISPFEGEKTTKRLNVVLGTILYVFVSAVCMFPLIILYHSKTCPYSESYELRPLFYAKRKQFRSWMTTEECVKGC